MLNIVANERPKTPHIFAHPPTVLIVDAYSSGRRLAHEFKQQGYRLIHLASRLKPATDLSVDRTVFDVVIDEQSSDHDTYALVRSFRPTVILPGCESGVLLADRLIHELELGPGNLPEKSTARRHKYLMIGALQSRGVPAAKHFLSSDPAKIFTWIEHHGLPVVIKPPSSTGTDAVTICHRVEDIHEAINRVLRSPSKLTQDSNHEVLVEEFLDGEEYMVDTVNIDGHTFFSEFVHSKKWVTSKGYSLYDYLEVLPFSDPAFEDVADYYLRVQNALGIRVGATHGELKRTSRGPRLIEIASRVGGGGVTEFAEHCYRHSSFSAIVDAYMHPGHFAKQYGRTNTLKKHGLLLCLINPKKRVLERSVDPSLFASLPSFSKLLWHYNVGDNMEETIDLFTAPGFVYLIHEDRDQIHADRETIRKLEKSLYGE